MARRARKSKARQSVKLKPADPFELIRWLARSQSDPRKAVAELVQNSLDAGARNIEVERVRISKEVALRVRDDGEGVLPERERAEALRHLATHIGHSHKLGLSPAERRERVVAGKYGVGLLGFWSMGRIMELRTRVNGSPVWALRMEEDSQRAEIDRVPLRTDLPPTFTEVIVAPLHDAARKPLGGRRLSEYLASELRGQLITSDASVVVHDRIARGMAQKRFDVVPRRYRGERLKLPAEIEVPGFSPIVVELYFARGAAHASIQVACAGTLVADDVAELGALGLDAHPWHGADVVGVLDFPSFNVPPGTRRGVVPDAAAMAFLTALTVLQPLVEAELERLDEKRQAAADRSVVRELRKALRGLSTRLPQYELPTVAAKRGEAVESAALGEPAGEPAPVDEPDEDPEDDPASQRPPLDNLELFPPGPLVSARVVPEQIQVPLGGQRRARAEGVDRDGRRLHDLQFAWTLEAPPALVLEGASQARPALRATADAKGTLHVDVSDGAHSVRASAAVTVIEPKPRTQGHEGVPEPVLVAYPDARWRSRMAGERWEVNEAHEDYRLVRDDARARLRYLLTLLAKEIVIRTSGRHDANEPLESLVQVLAHAERNLRR